MPKPQPQYSRQARAFVSRMVKSGRFPSPDAVIDEALRQMLRAEAAKARRIAELRELVDEADRSILRDGVVPVRDVIGRARARLAASTPQPKRRRSA